MRLTKTFKMFIYFCVGILFVILVLATIFNLFLPLIISCAQENLLWLLLYIADPLLLFADIYVWNLLGDLEWWF